MDMPVGTAPDILLHAKKFAQFMGWAAEIRRTAILGRDKEAELLNITKLSVQINPSIIWKRCLLGVMCNLLGFIKNSSID
jgi:hypothetical protein